MPLSSLATRPAPSRASPRPTPPVAVISVRDVLQVVAPTQLRLVSVYYLKHHGITLPPSDSPTEHELVVGQAPLPPA